LLAEYVCLSVLKRLIFLNWWKKLEISIKN